MHKYLRGGKNIILKKKIAYSIVVFYVLILIFLVYIILKMRIFK